jgi:hypothetical protein
MFQQTDKIRAKNLTDSDVGNIVSLVISSTFYFGYLLFF